MEDALTDKQRRYVGHLSRGMASRAAARSAGYSESFSRVAAHRLGKKPCVAQAIESIRAEGRTMAVYGLVEAMKEADDAAAFAKANKNSMALVKACELRAKLSGLLIDRVEVVPIDLRAALEQARSRVLDVTARLPCGADVAITGGAHWGPRLAGDPAPSAPE